MKGISGHGEDFKICAKELSALLQRAKMTGRRETANRVDRDGWRALRAWVKEGGFHVRDALGAQDRNAKIRIAQDSANYF